MLKLTQPARVIFLTRLGQVLPGSGQLHFLVISARDEEGVVFVYLSVVTSPLLFSKSVAPDGVLRLRICTLRKTANRLMEDSSV